MTYAQFRWSYSFTRGGLHRREIAWRRPTRWNDRPIWRLWSRRPTTACSLRMMPCGCWRSRSSPASARTFITTAGRAPWLCWLDRTTETLTRTETRSLRRVGQVPNSHDGRRTGSRRGSERANRSVADGGDGVGIDELRHLIEVVRERIAP